MIGTWPHQLFDSAASSFRLWAFDGAPAPSATRAKQARAASARLATRNRCRRRIMFSPSTIVGTAANRARPCERSGRRMRPHFKARKHLFADQVDRSQHLLMRGVSGLQNEDHLIETGFGPLFDLAADRIRISADGHAVGE